MNCAIAWILKTARKRINDINALRQDEKVSEKKIVSKTNAVRK